MVSTENRLAALTHDLAESIFTDMPSPIKPFITGFKKAEEAAHNVVAEKLGLSFPLDAEVDKADKAIVQREIAWLFPPGSKAWEAAGVKNREDFAPLRGLSPNEARKEWLKIFCEILCDEERWVEIPQWPYEVSTHGKIRRSKNGSDGRVLQVKNLKPWKSGTVDYWQVTLHHGTKRSVPFVHKVVMEVFLGPRPGGWEINHLDTDKTNNRLDNLEYTTHSENMLHSFASGRIPADQRAEKNSNSKLSLEDVEEIRSRYSDGETQVSLAEEFGVGQGQISRIILHKAWN